MKRLLIAVVAVAGLLGSVVAVAASVASPASAQTPVRSLTLVNTAQTAGPFNLNTVVVTVQTLGGCANTGGSLGGTALATGVGATFTVAHNSSVTAGNLSTACNWNVSYRNATGTCRVQGFPRASAASSNLNSDVLLNTLTLNGTGRDLQYNNQNVGAVALAVTSTCVDTIGDANITVTVPNTVVNNRNVYAGFKFDARVERSGGPTTGCTPAMTVSLTLPANANTVSMPVQTLIERPLDATTDCSYAVTFPAEVGALSIDAMAGNDLDISKANSTTGATPAASVTYKKTQVSVSVVTEYPQDEVFTTNDTVDYFINVSAPCGGYIDAIPVQFGSQGKVSSVQVFPGTVTVYSARQASVLTGVEASEFVMDAYHDVRGTQPCTVSVTEKNGPERCAPVGGATKSVTYSAGETFSFNFTHTCTASASGGSGGDQTGTTIDPDAPPTPPSIDLGGGIGDPGTGEPRPGFPG